MKQNEQTRERIKQELTERIHAANGDQKAALVLKNARIINVFTESIQNGDIAIENGSIAGIGSYEGVREIDLNGRYVCPGLIDGHIHLESSMVSPAEFEKAVLPHGTTAVITDPHEITNVAGCDGLGYMMEATEGLTIDVFFMLPSCVPSTSLDESGAQLHAEDLAPFYEHPRVLGLAELMNAYGTVRGEDDCMDKIIGAQLSGKQIDGHAPGIAGKALQAYTAAGIRSDHECSSLSEAMEKLASGQWIMIREGTAAKNMDALTGLFEAPFYQRAMFVTDDKHPGDLLRSGHMDEIVRLAIQKGADPIRAIRMCTLHTACYFGLHDRGAIAPGYRADLVILDDLSDMSVVSVFKDGHLAAVDGKILRPTNLISSEKLSGGDRNDRIFHSFRMAPITAEQLRMELRGTRQRVIDLVDHELTTTERITSLTQLPGYAPGVDPKKDIVKLAIFERHHGTGHVGLGFLGRYGLQHGAVATSVGHDSHNLVIAGTNDVDMAVAGNCVRMNEGGLAIARDGKVLADLPLPAAGLMSVLSLEETDQRLEQLKRISHELGISEDIDAFMTLAFVSLPVIPKLRISTFGVVDTEQQCIVESIF